MLESTQLLDSQLEIKNYNDDFLLIKSNIETFLSPFGKAIYERKFAFVRQVIVTEKEICLQLNSNFRKSDIDQLLSLTQTSISVSENFKLPVYFDKNEDWKEVIKVTNLDKNEIIKQLTKQVFPVAMFGFLPGFVYLNGLDKSLHVPRKKVPAKYVEAGSIAIGGKYLGLYGLDSPGGWHVIGKMPLSLLQIPNLPPLKINLGDTVTLYSVDENEFKKLSRKSSSLERNK